jgi:Protein of unknown function (DUF3892)
VTDGATPRVAQAGGMRQSIRVDCVTRIDRVSPHHRIRAIGGRGRDGEDWRLSEEAAITAIENGRATFYVERPKGHRIDVVVGQGLGKTFLKAESDHDSPDTLLALPDCL